MSGTCRLWTVVVSLGAFSACGGGHDVFTAAEWAKIQTLSPLPNPPKDTTNSFSDNPQAAILGQRLFHDTAFSGPIVVSGGATIGALGNPGEAGKIACASCHQADAWLNDRRSLPSANPPHQTAVGTNFMIRNASTAINSSYYPIWCENDGVRDTQWSDALTDPEDPTSMGGSRLLVAHVLFNKYRADYNALFTPPLDPALDPTAVDAARFPPNGLPGDGGPYDNMTANDKLIVDRIFSNFGKSVQAYVRLLVSKNAPFDKYVAGDNSAISESAKNGLKLFIGKASCITCHDTPLFSDDKFHDIGLAPQGDHIVPSEKGRYDAVAAMLGNEFNSSSQFSDDTSSGRLAGVDAGVASDIGKWRTKQLRTIAQTYPYMHTGQFATLDQVVDFYDQGGSDGGYLGTLDPSIKPLNLSSQEHVDLVNFLGTLTGDPISGTLTADTSH